VKALHRTSNSTKAEEKISYPFPFNSTT